MLWLPALRHGGCGGHSPAGRRPACGKPQKSKHFSVNAERGAHCHACGYSPSLKQLAETLGVDTGREYQPPAAPIKPAAPRPWQSRANVIAESLAQTPGAAQAWTRYKALPAAIIASRRLGYGIFPGGLWSQKTGRCEHARLIVPIYRAGAVTGFRCRAVACKCDKWLSPGGSKLWLYDVERIAAGATVWIVENPIDALMLQARGYQAVATFGASIWNAEYTAAIAASQPAQVIVCGDNDAAGRGMNARILQALRLARVPAAAYDWPAGTQEHFDIGQLLAA